MQEMAKRAVEYLLDATIKQGGGTVLAPLTCPAVPLTGFVVGIAGMTCDKDVMLQPQLWRGAVAHFVENHGHLTLEDNMGIGSWDCDVCGLIHIDLVKWTPLEHKARHLASIHEQVGYYNLDEQKTIMIRRGHGPHPQPAEEEGDQSA